MHCLTIVGDGEPLGILLTADAGANISGGGTRVLHLCVHEGTTVKQHETTFIERSECLGAIGGDGRFEDGIVRGLRNLMTWKAVPLVAQRRTWLFGSVNTRLSV